MKVILFHFSSSRRTSYLQTNVKVSEYISQMVFTFAASIALIFTLQEGPIHNLHFQHWVLTHTPNNPQVKNDTLFYGIEYAILYSNISNIPVMT